MECIAKQCETQANVDGGARSMCSKHYWRWKRGQDVDGKSQRDKTLPERFWEKVSKPRGKNACWVWTGSKNSKGYGHFRVATSGSTVVYKAHRWAWEEEHGVISPATLTIDHVVCGNTSCVRTSHMELVTRAENTRRMRARQKAVSA